MGSLRSTRQRRLTERTSKGEEGGGEIQEGDIGVQGTAVRYSLSDCESRQQIPLHVHQHQLPVNVEEVQLQG